LSRDILQVGCRNYCDKISLTYKTFFLNVNARKGDFLVRKKHRPHGNLMTHVNNILPDIAPLLSGCNRSLKLSFEDQGKK
jgi:hypothetical protein